jgi:epoxyqueuosine reductase
VTLTATAIKAKAREVGFDLCGVARADRHPKLARLASWIDAGYAGDLEYLRASLHERLDLTESLPSAQSVIALACVYNTANPYSTADSTPDRAVIARYAWGDDYHDVLRGRARALLEWMALQHGPGLEAFSCVDNGPVQERVFAEQAGIGWIGKNTCVISPQLGSWLFLAEIVTNLDLPPDAPVTDQCGSCTRCLDACPTGAIVEPYTVDATRCLSYLTIETRRAVDPVLRAAIGRQVLGCDICQDVCPWNRRAATSDDPSWQPRAPLASPSLLDLCRLSDDQWRTLLRASAMRRAGLRRIRRSLAYAAVHLAPADRQHALAALAAHASGADPDVVEAIVWSRESGQPGTLAII